MLSGRATKRTASERQGGGFGISISEMSCDPKRCILTARAYSLTFGEENWQFIRKLEIGNVILHHIRTVRVAISTT